jgi:hypothetical protein
MTTRIKRLDNKMFGDKINDVLDQPPADLSRRGFPIATLARSR